MSIASYVASVLAALIVLLLTFELLRRRKLKERHAIWWLIAGFVALILTAFPAVLDFLAAALGIAVPTNLVFFAGIAILFLVCLQYGSELTKLEKQVQTLAEENALLALKVERLSQSINE